MKWNAGLYDDKHYVTMHFDRKTELKDNENGLKDWLLMFGEGYFKGLEPVQVEVLLDEIQAKLKTYSLP